jgi:hypothetical protein
MKKDISYGIAIMQDVYTEIVEGIITGIEAKRMIEAIIANGWELLQDIYTIKEITSEFDEELNEWEHIITGIQEDLLKNY